MTNVLLGYVVNAVWQIPLAMVAALALTRIARPSAASCTRMLTGLLFLIVLTPAIPLLMPLFSSASPPIDPAVLASDASLSASAIVHLPLASEPQSFELSQWQAWLILGGAAVLIAIAAARLVLATAMTQFWLRRSRAAVVPESVMLHLRRFAERSGIAAPPVRTSESLAMPAVAGMFKPVIMIPERLANLEPQALRAVLLHECAHVARRDYAANWTCELLSLPLSWHPALYILKRELRLMRELACDEVAAASMPSPVHYATRLLEVARSGVQQRNRRLQIAPGLIGNGQLERRIEAIVDPRVMSWAMRTGGALLTGTIVIATCTCVALLRITPAVALDNQNQPGASPTPAISDARGSTFVPATGARNALPRAAARGNSSMQTTTVERGAAEYVHRWVSGSGRRYAILSSDPAEPTDNQKAVIESQFDNLDLSLRSAATKLDAARPELERRAATMQARVDSTGGTTPANAPTEQAVGPAPDSTRQWRVVRPEELPIIARGNEALKVMPDGTVLFSESPARRDHSG